MDDHRLLTHLRTVLCEEGFVRFCQALGGTRVYVPYKLRDDNEIVQAVGRDAADLLSRTFAPATIRVPLARRERALFFRAKQGLSNSAIARKLGITEGGVNRLFAREQDLPDKLASGRSPAQLTLL